MKNPIIFFIVILVSFSYSSCTEEAIKKFLPDINLVFRESIAIPVHVNQTDGTWETFTNGQSLSIINGDTSDLIDNIKAVKINSLSYKIINFTGDPSGQVDATFSVDNVVSLNNAITVKTSADNNTVYQISETSELSNIANDLLNNNSVTFTYSGSALSDNNDMDFMVEVTLVATITFDP